MGFAPRKQLFTKAARKSASIYGEKDYSAEENNSAEDEKSKFSCNQPEILE